MYIIQNTQDIEAVLVVNKETWEIVDEKRRARTCTCPSSTSSATSTEMVSVDAGTRRRSERVKVAPTRYASEVEEELLEAWSCACTGTSSASSASKEQMVAVGGTRRSKRVKVAPTRYDPVVEEEPCPLSPLASSCVVTMHTTLTAAVRHQQVLHEEKVLSSEEEESYNDSVRTFRCNPAIIRKQEKNTSTNTVI